MKIPKLDPASQLVLLILFFTLVILYCAKFHGDDGQLFQVFAGILTGLTGVLIGYGKKQLGVPDEPTPIPPGGKRVTEAAATVTETAPPQEPKP